MIITKKQRNTRREEKTGSQINIPNKPNTQSVGFLMVHSHPFPNIKMDSQPKLLEQNQRVLMATSFIETNEFSLRILVLV